MEEIIRNLLLRGETARALKELAKFSGTAKSLLSQLSGANVQHELDLIDPQSYQQIKDQIIKKAFEMLKDIQEKEDPPSDISDQDIKEPGENDTNQNEEHDNTSHKPPNTV